MPTSKSWNGTARQIPLVDETGWGSEVSGFLSDLADNAATKSSAETISNKTLRNADGSLGSPSISFVNDTDTGLYRSGANTLVLVTNGTARLTANATGQVTVHGDLAVSGAFNGTLTLATPLAISSGGTGGATAAAARAALDLEPGVDVQAYDAELAAIAGPTSAADKGIVFTGSGTASTFTLTSAARDLLDDASVADMRTTLGVPQLAAANTFTADQTISSTDDTASAGPTLKLYRNSPSPAASDQISVLSFRGNDAGGAEQVYANIYSVVSAATATTESGQLIISTTQSGATANRLVVGNGVYVGSATGGDMGANTINANGYYEGGKRGLSIIQRQTNRITGNITTSTTTPALDGSIPQIIEGVSIATQSITLAAGTKVRVRFALQVANSIAATNVYALFRQGTANAIGAWTDSQSGGAGNRMVMFEYDEDSPGAGAVVYELRFGTNGGTAYINQTSGGTDGLGGVEKSLLVVEEYQ